LKHLKNFIVGFLVSFVGSIPLGYLNFIGFEIYNKSNLTQLLYYLFGVLIIEGIVISSTFYFANKLILNPKLKKWISIFSIVFLIFIAIYFYPSESQNIEKNSNSVSFLLYPSFIIGLILSSLNVAQIPFWFSWNIFLVNENYISSVKNLKYIYVLGTLLGTFSGMLLLVLALKKITNQGIISDNFISNNIWIIFFGLAIFQIFQLLKSRKP
jgi:threonine/homoserine/homoserine lactone efflux protein